MRPENYRKFDQLTIADMLLLTQAYQRMRAEGMISNYFSFGDFLDCVVARGDYVGTATDEPLRRGEG